VKTHFFIGIKEPSRESGLLLDKEPLSQNDPYSGTNTGGVLFHRSHNKTLSKPSINIPRIYSSVDLNLPCLLESRSKDKQRHELIARGKASPKVKSASSPMFKGEVVLSCWIYIPQ
jgi:hypothetical protein